MRSLIWALTGHTSFTVFIWEGKALTRLHLRTASSEPSLVIHLPLFVCMWAGKILTRLYLWAFVGHSSSIVCVYVSREDSGDTEPVHIILGAFDGYPSSILVYMRRHWTCVQYPVYFPWLLMLHIIAYVSRKDSDETALVHSLPWAVAGLSSSIYCVCKQERFWRDCICAQSPLKLRWSLIFQFLCVKTRNILTRLICAQSPLKLPWSVVFLFCVSKCFDKIAPLHSLPWAFAGQSSSNYCVWAMKIFRDCT